MIHDQHKKNQIKKYFTNTFWLIIGKIINLAVGLIVSIYVARYLGPEQYGLLSFALAFVLLFSPLSQLGLHNIVVRNIVREPNNANTTIGTAFTLRILGSIFVLILSISTIIFIRPNERLVWYLVGIISAGNLFRSFDITECWFESKVKSKLCIFARTLSLLIISATQIILVVLNAPLIFFAVTASLEIALVAIGLLIVFKTKSGLSEKVQINFQTAKSLLQDSWPVMLSGGAVMIQAHIDQVMLGQMLGNESVGQYSIAIRLISVFGFIPVAICASIAPAITRAHKKDKNLYSERLLNNYRLMFVLFIITAIPIFFIAKPLVLFLYGSSYQYAGALLSLFAFRLFFTNFGVAKSLFITNENMFQYALVIAIVGALTNIGLNIVLIPKYQAIGAIWATIISFAIMTFICDIFYHKAFSNLKLMLRAIISPWKIRIL